MVNKKEKKTLEVLVITPTSIVDVFMAKRLLGFILIGLDIILIGVVILTIKRARQLAVQVYLS